MLISFPLLPHLGKVGTMPKAGRQSGHHPHIPNSGQILERTAEAMCWWVSASRELARDKGAGWGAILHVAASLRPPTVDDGAGTTFSSASVGMVLPTGPKARPMALRAFLKRSGGLEAIPERRPQGSRGWGAAQWGWFSGLREPWEASVGRAASGQVGHLPMCVYHHLSSSNVSSNYWRDTRQLYF